jgi:hypothetical protein
MLTFEVASFDIGYNCILRRSFLQKFMAVIHTTYATIKMPGPKGIITLKSDQCDALACENAALTHDARRKHSNQNGGTQATGQRHPLPAFKEEEHIRRFHIKPARR